MCGTVCCVAVFSSIPDMHMHMCPASRTRPPMVAVFQLQQIIYLIAYTTSLLNAIADIKIHFIE